MNTHDIELPPLPTDEIADAGAYMGGSQVMTVESAEAYARAAVNAAIEADRKNTAELLKSPVHVHTNMCRGIIAPITFDQLAHVLGDEATKEWIADRQQRGEPVGWLRNERGEATGASTLDPLFLLGASMPTGYVASYSPVYPQPATPVIKESLTVAEPAQEAIEAYDAIDNFLRNNLYDDDYALYSKALDDVFSYGQPAQPAASAEPIGYITPAAIDLLREGRYVTLCPTSIDQGVPVFLGAELAASVGGPNDSN